MRQKEPFCDGARGRQVNPMSLPDQEAAETPVPILNSKAVVQVPCSKILVAFPPVKANLDRVLPGP